MNQEKLKFIPGDVVMVPPADGDSPSWNAPITVVGQEVWLSRICVYGYNPDNAEALRARLLWALEQPTAPTQWQYKSVFDWDGNGGHVWVNLDNGGEAARVKGEGHEVRALYQKQPVREY